MAIKTFKDYPNIETPLSADNINEVITQFQNIEDSMAGIDTDLATLQTGWNEAGETWTYSSVDDPTGIITIVGDVTTKYSLGMRIKFTNGGNTIYGIITAISYSSPNTTLTFLHEIDPTDSLALHLMADSAITANYYSSMKAPFGFPIKPSQWTINGIYPSTNTNLSKPANNKWYNIGSARIKIPVGSWNTILEASGLTYADNTSDKQEVVALSTSSNSLANPIYSSRMYTNSQNYGFTIASNSSVELTTATTYYLIENFQNSSSAWIYFHDSASYFDLPLVFVFKAVCAYL